ncbi:Methyltransferase domain-containing protein [Klenkia marina]|uniref:Methyltransferase domain-containing protein n=1 Tax=Klenkia marina TaxID=1960309 RepID=A0A1G4YG84_9ACTN|nr:class I SAM-dependent methyltransferase [Klenkia marina]SCX52520.1 Methyltransferase domain-containing protein [Klenkia marina]
MSRLPDRAARRAFAAYRNAPVGHRAHLLVRWVTCPFAPLVDVLPTHGRVLEVGCGHGLFSTYLAERSPGLAVHGVDIDADKVAVAAASTRPGDRRSFAVAPSGAVPAGPWDAVVLVDVLYLLDAAGQRALLEECAARLAPGGVLVVKDMAVTPLWKARVNALQETVSVRLLGITEGSRDFDFVPPDERARWLVAAGLVDVRSRRLDRGRAHPHHLLVGRAAS